MAIEKRVEAHIIFSKYRFPYLVWGSGPIQSTMTLLKDYSKADTNRSGATRMFWFGFHITRLMSQNQQFSATFRFIFGLYKWAIIPLEDFLTPKCLFIDESWATLKTAFLYSSCTTIWQITLHSSCTVALTFSASSTENDLEQDSTSSFFCALINCSLVRRSLLTYINVGLRTGPSLIDLWSWTVSRWDI